MRKFAFGSHVCSGLVALQSVSIGGAWLERRITAGLRRWPDSEVVCALVRHRVSYQQARADTFQSVACSALDVAIDVPYMKEVSLMRHSNLRLHVISEVDTIRQFAAFKNQHSPNVSRSRPSQNLTIGVHTDRPAHGRSLMMNIVPAPMVAESGSSSVSKILFV